MTSPSAHPPGKTFKFDDPSDEFACFYPSGKHVFCMFSAIICGAICALILNEFRHRFQIDFVRFLAYIFNQPIIVRDRRNQTVNDLIEQRLQDSNSKSQSQSNVNNAALNVCFVDYLLSLNNARAEDIADLFVLFAAGMETTSSTLEFGIVLLAKQPQIQQQIRAKLMQNAIAIGNDRKNDDYIQFDIRCMNKVPRFRALIYEILRISSVGSIGIDHSNLENDVWINARNKSKFNFQNIIRDGTI
jgi:hypothetical protein